MNTLAQKMFATTLGSITDEQYEGLMFMLTATVLELYKFWIREEGIYRGMIIASHTLFARTFYEMAYIAATLELFASGKNYHGEQL